MKDSSFRKNDGFTFVETLVSVSILAFVIVGVVLMSAAHIRSNSFTSHHTRSVQLAEDGLEWLRRLDYNSELINANGRVDNFGDIVRYPDFRRAYTVTWGAELSTLQVSVTWRSRGRDAAPVVLTSMRTLQ